MKRSSTFEIEPQGYILFHKVQKHSKPPPLKYLWQELVKLAQTYIFFLTTTFRNEELKVINPAERGADIVEVFLSASAKAKLLAENFSKKTDLDDASTSLPAFPPGTTLKMHNIPATPMLVKKAITDFDLLNASSPDCIPVMALKKCESKLLSLLANSSKYI